NTPPRGIGKQTVEKLVELASSQQTSMLDACRQAVADKVLSKRAHSAVASFLKIYDQLVSIVHGPLLDLLQVTVELTHYRDYLLKQNRGGESETEVFANLDELLAEARELDVEADGEKSALESFLEVSALQADTDRLDNTHDLVTLMTLHAAKGLEFSNVYVIAVEENVLPHARSKDDPLSLEEERRLLFVGITRAQDQLQLSYAKSRGFSGMGSGVPSSFLMELPRSEMQVNDRTESFADEFSADGGWDDYQAGPAEDWDELNQAGPDDEMGQVHEEFDEACQLPAEEIMRRLAAAQSAVGRGRLRIAGQRPVPPEEEEEEEPEEPWAEFRVGRLVKHDKFGQGEILSASGRGAKRSVTINFFSDGARRTFRLSHVPLVLCST
ncbi:MAG: ATP-binding domain-containing protein, partial [Planctomycetales bacterium]|nr:ATP-binding domain-containing protein [Planctomycetales bacterium]